MQVTACPASHLFAQYVLGTLSEERVGRLEEHLNACSKCEQHVAQLEQQPDMFIKALQQPPPCGFREACEDTKFQVAVAKIKKLDNLMDTVSGADPLAQTQSPVPVGATSSSKKDLGQIGQYRLLERIGRGGMGTVFRALHTRLEKEYPFNVSPTYAS